MTINIHVEICDECHKDNWKYPLLEIRIGNKQIWLCNGCLLELIRKLNTYTNRFHIHN